MDTKDIKETLKKYFYTGVSLAAHSAEAVQHSINELVKDGKMSEADGRRIVANAIKKVEEARPELEAKYNKAIHQFIQLSTNEISKLQKKVQQMEKQLKVKRGAASNGTAAKSAARPKTATKKAKATKKRATR